jgi:hypothetical protein
MHCPKAVTQAQTFNNRLRSHQHPTSIRTLYNVLSYMLDASDNQFAITKPPIDLTSPHSNHERRHEIKYLRIMTLAPTSFVTFLLSELGKFFHI